MIIVIIGVMIVKIITRERDDLLPQLKPQTGSSQGTLIYTGSVYPRFRVDPRATLSQPKGHKRRIKPT